MHNTVTACRSSSAENGHPASLSLSNRPEKRSPAYKKQTTTSMLIAFINIRPGAID